MLIKLTQLNISEFARLYDILFPKDNELRQINELIDFVYDELKDKYSATMCRGAVSPIMMFKYLLLKAMYTVSDVGFVKRAYTDMAYKYFLGLNTEDPVIALQLLLSLEDKD